MGRLGVSGVLVLTVRTPKWEQTSLGAGVWVCSPLSLSLGLGLSVSLCLSVFFCVCVCVCLCVFLSLFLSLCRVEM